MQSICWIICYNFLPTQGKFDLAVKFTWKDRWNIKTKVDRNAKIYSSDIYELQQPWLLALSLAFPQGLGSHSEFYHQQK